MKISQLRVLGAMVSAAVLSGCFTATIPPLEDAVPIPTDKNQYGVFLTSGINLRSTLDQEKVLSGLPYTQQNPAPAVVTGLHIGLPVSPRFSLHGRIWTGGFSGDVYGKYTFLTQPCAMAILPGIQYNSCEWFHDWTSEKHSLYVLSINLPVATTVDIPHLCPVTLVARESFGRVLTLYDPDDSDGVISSNILRYWQRRTGVFADVTLLHHARKSINLQAGYEWVSSKYTTNDSTFQASIRWNW